jgi:peptidoglycan hydrolase CwlO-like protein
MSGYYSDNLPNDPRNQKEVEAELTYEECLQEQIETLEQMVDNLTKSVLYRKKLMAQAQKEIDGLVDFFSTSDNTFILNKLKNIKL